MRPAIATLSWEPGRDNTNTDGSNNLFLGRGAGYRNTTGNANIFLGRSAGRSNITGSRNIFIGTDAGSAPEYTGESDKLVIGNGKNNESRTWIVGDIGTDTLIVNGKRVCLHNGPTCTPTPSSRTLKKNIKVFKNFDKALQDILKTPLFSYQFKDKNNQPDKKRMGIISEELPESLQIKSKPIQPDWPSIYGTLWAGIKALHKLFVDFRKDILSKLKEMNMNLRKDILSKLKEELAKVFKDLKDTKTAQDQTVKQLEVQKKMNKEKLAKVFKALEDTKAAQDQKIKQLETIQTEKLETVFKDFKNTKATQDQTVKQLEAIQTENTRLSRENTRLSRELEEQKSKNTQFSRELEETKEQINELKTAIENQSKTN